MRKIYGFTLVELLLACSIIAVLAGTLLPALNRAKLAASKTECLNTLRQLNIAENSYVLTYDDFMLPIKTGSGNLWMDLLYPFAPRLCSRKNKNDNTISAAVPLCSRSRAEDGRQITYTFPMTYSLWNSGNVVKNMGGGYTRWIEMGGDGESYPFVKMSRIKTPSDKITFFDGYIYLLALEELFDNFPDKGVTAWGIHEHGRINVIYTDGHAEPMARRSMNYLSGGKTVKQRHFQPFL